MPTFNWKPPTRPWIIKANDANSSRGRSPHAYEPRYKSKRWQRLRLAVLQSSPLCVSCRDSGVVRPARVVDHIRPVRRGGAFWDVHNLQTMCESCHNSKSGKESHGLDISQGDRGSRNKKGNKQKTIESKSTPSVKFSTGES